MSHVIRDFAEALAAVGLIGVLSGPVVYGLWRGRDAPNITRVSAKGLWLCLAIGLSVALIVFLGGAVIRGTSSGEVGRMVGLIIAAIPLYAGVIAGFVRLVRRR